MIKKYRFGDPFETEAVVENIQAEHGEPKFGETSIDNGFSFSYMMDEDEIVYGLGEANRGINKRGYRYVSDCSDDPNHTEVTLRRGVVNLVTLRKASPVLIFVYFL